MARTPLGRRYAQAVFAIALEEGALEEWRVELARSTESLADDQTKVFLQSPKVNFQRKLELLRSALSDVRENVFNLVGLIVKNGALQALDGIAIEYQKLLDDLQGREQVEITTAIELEEMQKSRLQKQLTSSSFNHTPSFSLLMYFPSIFTTDPFVPQFDLTTTTCEGAFCESMIRWWSCSNITDSAVTAPTDKSKAAWKPSRSGPLP